MKGSAGWAKAKEGSGIGEGTAEAIAKEAGAALTLEREVKHISEKGSAGCAKAKEGSGIGGGHCGTYRERAGVRCEGAKQQAGRKAGAQGAGGTCGAFDEL